MAAYLAIDTTDLAPEEIADAIEAAVEALDSDGLAALSEKLQIDATDMTDEEIVSAIEALLIAPQPTEETIG